MGSDIARKSHDPTRKWRGLVAQQGRVTVEADWNEAAAIDAAHDRHVTLDVVGPVGSPDGGYLVRPGQAGSPPSSSPPTSAADLTVGKGTLYLGGERLDLWADVDVDNQPDWLDPVTGNLWLAPQPTQPSPPATTGNTLVYLLAIEQEVSAREDPALADVALGGPDTMQRLRVLQRFVRWRTQSTSCTQAWNEVTTAWGDIGLSLDSSMRLKSSARLEVGFVTDAAPPSPCQPVATGGYLGAENQLIRVQIASVDADGVPTIVWGFDDATFLYKLSLTTPDNSGNVILTLANAPVDSYHNPVTGQAVELLRDAASLTPDDPNSATDDGYIAAAAGAVFTLSQGYNTSAGTVAISGNLPAGYQDANQLFLRVWQASMPAPAGTAVTLSGAGANTGVTVTLTSDDGVFHPGDFWCFALRPSVPSLIYPARYGDAGQPPEGARVLACPIAMVTQPEEGAPTVSSCIPPFDNLVELTGRGSGCCTLRVTPDALATTSLNTLLTRYAGQEPIKVCFAPGVYTLTEPLIFDTSFAGITLEGCGGPVTLRAPDQPGAQFLLGLIVLEGTSGVTIRGIDLVTPLVSFAPGDSFSVLSRALGVGSRVLLEQFAVSLRVAVGISARNTSGLVVDGCHFSVDCTELQVAASIFGVGILANGSLSETTVTDCVFDTAPIPDTVPFYDLAVANPATDARPMPPYRLTFGYLQVPTATWTRTGDTGSASAPGELHDAVIEDCRFHGITVPALVMAQLGTIRLENNTVQECFAGFWLFSLSALVEVMAFELIPTGDMGSNSELAAIGLSVLADGIVLLALAMTRVLPATPPTANQVTGPGSAQLDPAILSVAAQRLRGMLNQSLTTLAGTSSATTGTPAPATKLLSNLVADVHKMFSRQQPTATSAPSQDPAAAAKTVAMATQTPSPTQPAAPAGPPPVSDLVSKLLPNFNDILVNAGAPTPQVAPATDTGTQPVLRLALSGNEIDAVVANSYSGPGLLVADMTATFGSILLTGNRVTNRFPNGQAAVICTVEDAVAINGNIVANETAAAADQTRAAMVVGAPAAPANTTCSLFCMESESTSTDTQANILPVTIVGNVLVSAPILLPTSPLNYWLRFNAVMV
jgi:hypothetical protein